MAILTFKNRYANSTGMLDSALTPKHLLNVTGTGGDDKKNREQVGMMSGQEGHVKIIPFILHFPQGNVWQGADIRLGMFCHTLFLALKPFTYTSALGF